MIPRSSYRHQRRRNDNGLRERLTQLAHECPRFGYRRLHVLLRRGGERINHKRVPLSGLVCGAKHCSGSHTTGQAHAERPCRKLSRPLARRVFKHELVREPMGCTAQDPSLAERIQPTSAALGAWLSHTGGVCVLLGERRFAFQPYRYCSAATESRPSPAGACGGLDSAPAPQSG